MPGDERPLRDGASPDRADGPRTLACEGDVRSGAHPEAGEACDDAGGPAVVYVERPRLGRGLTAFLVVVASVALLCFMGCSAAVTGAAAGVASLLSGGTAGSLGRTAGPQIAVFHMDQTLDSASGITPELVRSVVRQVDNDPSIVALVVRCDSGGGGAAASEEISSYIASCTKPVVFSVGSTCASGAYMAAAQADWIVANPTSSVGAIGTLVTVYDLEGLYDMLGISVDSITSSESKDMGASYRALTDDERAKLQEQVDRVTELFVFSVADGRGLDEEVVEGWADGTTYLGEDALAMGMVDELGTYDDALAKAAELAGVAYGECGTVSLDPTYSELDTLATLLG